MSQHSRNRTGAVTSGSSLRAPALARDCRVYIYHTALRLGLPIKGAGLPEGIEIFPRQDEIGAQEFGNAIRAPLGVHRGAKDEPGLAVLVLQRGLHAARPIGVLERASEKLTETELQGFIAGRRSLQNSRRAPGGPRCHTRYFTSTPTEFRILDYVEVKRQVGRNFVARCPSCATRNHDQSGDNLAICVEEPRKYICWAGCTKEMIREALGRPVKEKRYA